VNNLPLNGRNFTFLAQLAAGVNSPKPDTRATLLVALSLPTARAPRRINYLLDGIDNNSDTVDFLNGTNFVVLPPVDAIQEFKVQILRFQRRVWPIGSGSSQCPPFKSGTNSFHGAGWEFFRNDKLDAKDYFESKEGRTTTESVRCRRRGAGHKNKIFFFADYEALRRRQGSPHSNGSVPTAPGAQQWVHQSARVNHGSDRDATDLLGRIMPTGTILDPATTRAVAGGFVRDPFSAVCPASTTTYTLAACPDLNMLPAAGSTRMHSHSLNLYPTPTGSGIFGQLFGSPALKEDRKAWDTKIDP